MIYAHNGLLLALKRKEILIHTTTQTNLEDLMLGESNQSQKDKRGGIPLLWGSLSSQSHRGRKENGGGHGLREWENGELAFSGYRVSVREDEKNSGDGEGGTTM